jgi:hypothetical protein
MSTPKIDHYRFGQITIDGVKYSKDVIIYPERVQDNWWRVSGHRLAVKDLADVLASPPEVLVVGLGNMSRMNIPQNTNEALRAAGIEVIAQSTGDACQTYNRLSETHRVVAALHLTC